MKQFRPSTWFGEELLQQWGHWVFQHLEKFGSGGGASAGSDGGERRLTRAVGDYSDPVLSEIISTEIASALNQTLHLRIAEAPSLDRRVAIIRYVGRQVTLPEFSGEPVIWKGDIEIGVGPKARLEFPEPPFLTTICVPVEQTPAAIGRELEMSPEQVREATRRLRALAVKTFRSVNENKRRKAA